MIEQPNTSRDALLPCPFCGNGARMLKREIGLKGRANWDWWHAIQCAKCNASVGYDDNRYRDKSDCTKAWNTRPQADILSKLSCPELVEVMAVAIYDESQRPLNEAFCVRDNVKFFHLKSFRQSSFRDMAKAALAALRTFIEQGGK